MIAASKYHAALIDPFSTQAEGAQIPDYYSFPTVTETIRQSYTITADSSNGLDFCVLPNLLQGLVCGVGCTLSGNGVVTAYTNPGDPAAVPPVAPFPVGPYFNYVDFTNSITSANNTGNTCDQISPTGSSNLQTSFATYRIVGYGVRVYNRSAMQYTQGQMTMAEFPVVGDTFPLQNEVFTSYSDFMAFVGGPLVDDTVNLISQGIFLLPGAKSVASVDLLDGLAWCGRVVSGECESWRSPINSAIVGLTAAGKPVEFGYNYSSFSTTPDPFGKVTVLTNITGGGVRVTVDGVASTPPVSINGLKVFGASSFINGTSRTLSSGHGYTVKDSNGAIREYEAGVETAKLSDDATSFSYISSNNTGGTRIPIDKQEGIYVATGFNSVNPDVRVFSVLTAQSRYVGYLNPVIFGDGHLSFFFDYAFPDWEIGDIVDLSPCGVFENLPLSEKRIDTGRGVVEYLFEYDGDVVQSSFTCLGVASPVSWFSSNGGESVVIFGNDRVSTSSAGQFCRFSSVNVAIGMVCCTVGIQPYEGRPYYRQVTDYYDPGGYNNGFLVTPGFGGQSYDNISMAFFPEKVEYRWWRPTSRVANSLNYSSISTFENNKGLKNDTFYKPLVGPDCSAKLVFDDADILVLPRTVVSTVIPNDDLTFEFTTINVNAGTVGSTSMATPQYCQSGGFSGMAFRWDGTNSTYPAVVEVEICYLLEGVPSTTSQGGGNMLRAASRKPPCNRMMMDDAIDFSSSLPAWKRCNLVV